MRITKVFNNNAISYLTTDGKDVIALGSGIGFSKKINDVIDENKIEKIYYVQNDMQTKFLELIKDNDLSYLDIAEEILKEAVDAGLNVDCSVVIALADHIRAAVVRAEANIELPNLILNELKVLYKDEFSVALSAVELINKKINGKLPKEEAGYIALHIIQANKSQTPENILRTVSFINSSVKLIEEIYGLSFIEDEFYFFRLTTHLKFLANRVLNKEIDELSVNEEMYNFIIKSNSLHQKFALSFKNQIKSLFGCRISNQEVLYIVIHISKFLSK